MTLCPVAQGQLYRLRILVCRKLFLPNPLLLLNIVSVNREWRLPTNVPHIEGKSTSPSCNKLFWSKQTLWMGECILTLCLLTYFKVSKIPVQQIVPALRQVLCQHGSCNYPLDYHIRLNFRWEKRLTMGRYSKHYTVLRCVMCLLKRPPLSIHFEQVMMKATTT